MTKGETSTSVFVHIVTFDSEQFIEKCLRSVATQEEFSVGTNLFIHVFDNASIDRTIPIIEENFGSEISIVRSERNIGFSGGHNAGCAAFLESGAQFFLVLNPDVRLEKRTLITLVRALESDREAGIATPRLYRADDNLLPPEPRTLDAAGMILTASLRHFDRASGEPDSVEYLTDSYVFGGTGACLLLRRDCVADLLLDGGEREADLERVHPELIAGQEQRAQLFDEGFFAYREDADLSWRAQLYGWKCRYVASAVGYHRRKVLPELRSELPAKLNFYGVRNRFLLQLNNYSITKFPSAFIPGVLIRNLLVVLGVIFIERSSLRALLDAWRLMPRALARRRKIMERAKEKKELLLAKEGI